jgi:hypothetical protein
VEPACSCLVSASPPGPVQVVAVRVPVEGQEAVQAFDLGDGEGDQSWVAWGLVIGVGRWWRLAVGPGAGQRGGHGADGQGGHGQHGMTQDRGVEAHL